MTEIIAVALFTLLAVISPGADFAMVTRSSYAQGRKAGLAAAVGMPWECRCMSCTRCWASR